MFLTRRAAGTVLDMGAGSSLTRTGSTAEGAILAVRIPPLILGLNGQLHISAQYRRTTGSAKIGARIRAGTSGTGGDSVISAEHDTDGTILLDCIIAAAGAHNAQVCSPPLQMQILGSAPVLLTLDFTAEQFITFCGRTEGSASDVLTLQRRSVIAYPRP